MATCYCLQHYCTPSPSLFHHSFSTLEHKSPHSFEARCWFGKAWKFNPINIKFSEVNNFLLSLICLVSTNSFSAIRAADSFSPVIVNCRTLWHLFHLTNHPLLATKDQSLHLITAISWILRGVPFSAYPVKTMFFILSRLWSGYTKLFYFVTILLPI